MGSSEVRNALITGASSGIGMVTSVELARKGYHVVASMRDTRKAEKLLKSAEEAGAFLTVRMLIANGYSLTRQAVFEHIECR
jgi:short-subunit dehydrogenase